jgi:hypothetical protein
MTKVISGLEEKGCLSIGDTTKEGTEYTINLPYNIPIVKEKIATKQPEAREEDFFTEPQNEKYYSKEITGFVNIAGKK